MASAMCSNHDVLSPIMIVTIVDYYSCHESCGGGHDQAPVIQIGLCTDISCTRTSTSSSRQSNFKFSKFDSSQIASLAYSFVQIVPFLSTLKLAESYRISSLAKTRPRAERNYFDPIDDDDLMICKFRFFGS